MARPKDEGQDLTIYLTVCRWRWGYPHRKPVPYCWAYEAMRQSLAEVGVHLGQQGEYGAIRAACARGKIIAVKLAKRYGLPPSLSEEQLAYQVWSRFSASLHEREMQEREDRAAEESARDRAYYAPIIKRAEEEVLRLEKEAVPRSKKKK